MIFSNNLEIFEPSTSCPPPSTLYLRPSPEKQTLRERPEVCKSRNLIGSGSGRNFFDFLHEPRPCFLTEQNIPE